MGVGVRLGFLVIPFKIWCSVKASPRKRPLKSCILLLMGEWFLSCQNRTTSSPHNPAWPFLLRVLFFSFAYWSGGQGELKKNPPQLWALLCNLFTVTSLEPRTGPNITIYWVNIGWMNEWINGVYCSGIRKQSFFISPN